MPELKDKTAVITGAGRGIGKRLAIAFAKEGAKVGLLARTLPELHLTQLEITHAGGASMVAPADVAEPRQVEEAIDAVRRRFGAIDILVCAAGIQGPIGPAVSAEPQAWAEVLRVNLLGVFHCCRAVLPEMIARRSGKIINVSGGGAASARPGSVQRSPRPESGAGTISRANPPAWVDRSRFPLGCSISFPAATTSSRAPTAGS